ncbi:MAG: hypothetical protein MnENMB40S_22660 [Rhizobiaceae bacterium MnEN-MB40S]|nr:MAG: hypothetical protein MnENMB40S_22660 [Rhizobiaceae bacterium MnEN-MB40S]
MTTDPFDSYNPGLDSPLTSALNVTPDDENDLPVIPRGFHCQGGAIKVTTMNDETVTFDVGADNGALIPMRIKRVWATDTTATNIFIVW